MCPHLLWITVLLQVLKLGTVLIAVGLWPNTLHSIAGTRLHLILYLSCNKD